MKKILVMLFLCGINFALSAHQATEVMNPRVKVVKPGDSLGRAAQIMIDYGYDFVPVVDQNLVGVVTSFGLLNFSSKKTDWSSVSIQESQLIEKAKTLNPQDEVDIINFKDTLFVVDSKKELLGVIAAQDVLSHDLLKPKK